MKPSSEIDSESHAVDHSIDCLSCAQARALARSLNRAAIVAITDRKGTIIYVNENFERISGYSAHELLGSNHRILNSGRHPKSFWTEMYRQVAAGRVWRGEVCNRSKSGEEYWVDTAVSGVRDDFGRIIQYVAIRFDITNRKSSEHELQETKSSLEQALRTAADLNNDLESKNAELRRATLAAETAARAKSNFLANMSHEIRTPMNAILGFAEILADEDKHGVSAEQRGVYLQSICRQGNHLLCLLNDILDLSKIESGMLCTEKIPFDPHSVLHDMSQAFAHRAHAKGIELFTVADSGVPNMIHSDPTRVVQVLTNLIGNAIKFTEQGSVELRLHTCSGPEQDSIMFVVADTGIGIDQESISRIFNPFEQADASITRKHGGTGLGLCICKELAEALGGEILVQSEAGSGSIFTLRLPLGNAQRQTDPHSDASQAIGTKPAGSIPLQKPKAEPLHGVRVLLAEDGDDNAMLIMHHLKRAGASVTRVANGLEAVNQLFGDQEQTQQNSGFDVVIMDIQMPVMDGYMATEEIRNRGCRVPIIAATAHAMEDDQRRCHEAGCSDYIAKPIDRATLLNTVLDAIKRNRSSAA